MIWINVIETSRCVCFYLSWSSPVTTKQYYYVIEMETAPISYKKNIYCKHIIYANNMNKIHQYFFFIQPQTILKKKKSDHFQRKHCVRQFIGCPLHPLCTSPCCNRQKKKKNQTKLGTWWLQLSLRDRQFTIRPHFLVHRKCRSRRWKLVPCRIAADVSRCRSSRRRISGNRFRAQIVDAQWSHHFCPNA